MMKSLSFMALASFLTLSQASAMEMACSSIKGAGMGDFDFSQICLSDTFAVLRVGSFESSDYLYAVKTGPRVANLLSVTLVPQKAQGYALGQQVELAVFQNSASNDLLGSLQGKGVVAQIWGDPTNSKSGIRFAEEFKKQEVPVTL